MTVRDIKGTSPSPVGDNIAETPPTPEQTMGLAGVLVTNVPHLTLHSFDSFSFPWEFIQGNPLARLVGIQIDLATMENSMEISFKN